MEGLGNVPACTFLASLTDYIHQGGSDRFAYNPCFHLVFPCSSDICFAMIFGAIFLRISERVLVAGGCHKFTKVEHIIGPGGDTIEKLVESTASEINISCWNAELRAVYNPV